ncbi:hypothetical protein LN995_19900 [Pontibacter silvestris]|nr:hypothetical protein [Pontibacter silvestris]MCC9138692.1 hypothetical protein [Pontibacter silvestris]
MRREQGIKPIKKHCPLLLEIGVVPGQFPQGFENWGWWLPNRELTFGPQLGDDSGVYTVCFAFDVEALAKVLDFVGQ